VKQEVQRFKSHYPVAILTKNPIASLKQGFASGSTLFELMGPDPHFECEIRIRIQEEGKNYPQKVNNFHVLKCWMSSFKGLKASPVAWASFMEA
jgi:hypothetical protein